MTQEDSIEIKKADEHFDEEAGSEELLRRLKPEAEGDGWDHWREDCGLDGQGVSGRGEDARGMTAGRGGQAGIVWNGWRKREKWEQIR